MEKTTPKRKRKSKAPYASIEDAHQAMVKKSKLNETTAIVGGLIKHVKRVIYPGLFPQGETVRYSGPPGAIHTGKDRVILAII